MATLHKYTTPNELALELGLHDSRIRQICRSLSLGVVIGGRRFLTAKDCERVRQTKRVETRTDRKAATAGLT